MARLADAAQKPRNPIIVLEEEEVGGASVFFYARGEGRGVDFFRKLKSHPSNPSECGFNFRDRKSPQSEEEIEFRSKFCWLD